MEPVLQAPPEAAITSQPPMPVVLDAGQQAHVNALIEAARQGAARDLREELQAAKRAETALQAEITALRESRTPQTDEELVSTQARLRAAEAEVATTRADLKTAAAHTALQTAVAAGNFVNNAHVATLLREAAGASDGSAASLAQIVANFGANNPNMVRSNVIGGAGSKPSHGTPAPERIDISSIFGRGSNGALANALMMRNKPEYMRLRALAVASGLIGG